jgi:hypothetical protein
MCAEGRLVSCLTTSFDGLEARGVPALEATTVMLHSDNRVLCCCCRGCLGMGQEETTELDGVLLHPVAAGDPLDLPYQLCEVCYKKCEWCSDA